MSRCGVLLGCGGVVYANATLSNGCCCLVAWELEIVGNNGIKALAIDALIERPSDWQIGGGIGILAQTSLK